MNRRELGTIAGVAFVHLLFRHRLLADSIATRWWRDVRDTCNDLRTDQLDIARWRTKLAELHARLPVEDLARMVDLDAVKRRFVYPDRGVVTSDLPGIEGTAFIARVFGMAKGRAIIPHGHRNMVSCHRVIAGELHLRQYDRVRDDGDALVVRQTRDEIAKLGATTSISEAADNVHWMIATTAHAHTFDVIVVDLHGKQTAIDNLDLSRATPIAGGMLRAQKLDVGRALAAYG